LDHRRVSLDQANVTKKNTRWYNCCDQWVLYD
jgi:hypothetical protein